MSVTPPSDIPAELAAGETWTWTKSLTDYPASAGWTLTYYFAGAQVFNAAATADGDDYLVTVAATTSAAKTAGTYEYLARVSLAGDVYNVGSGTVVIRPNLATAAAGDRQAHAERMIPILEAEIAARVTGDGSGHAGYTIGDRAIEKFSLLELQKLLGSSKAQLLASRNGGRLPERHVVFRAAR